MKKPGLADSDLPGLFAASDQSSLLGQKRYTRSFGTRLGLTVAAAAFSAFSVRLASGLDVAAFLVAGIFVAIVLVDLWQLEGRPAELWYDARALAESTKTLAWRYSVGAVPFSVSSADAHKRLLDELGQLISDMPDGLIPSASPAVSSRMEELRESGLDTRKAVYIADRIDNQSRWYTGKAQFSERRARAWRFALVVAELLGVAAAILKGLNLFPVDAPGVVAALIGAGSAWLAVKQHDANARAYTRAAEELALARQDLLRASEEAAWSVKVADAEEAISREHTMWRASRASATLVRSLTKQEKRLREL